MRKNHWVSLAIALLIAALFALLEQRRGHYFYNALFEPDQADRMALLMQKAEWFTYDLRSKFESHRKPHPDILVITIDDTSLKVLHQWPWPRSVHARLIQKLEKAHPKALAFDIFFVDPFTSDAKGDRQLVEATRRNSWVIHSAYAGAQGHHLTQVTWPFPELRAAAHALGYVNAFVDEDGVLRTALPDTILDGQKTYLLSVLATSQYLGKSPYELLKPVPRDPHGQVLVHFVGSEAKFKQIAYEDVLIA